MTYVWLLTPQKTGRKVSHAPRQSDTGQRLHFLRQLSAVYK
jgi:hypothetical protein